MIEQSQLQDIGAGWVCENHLDSRGQSLAAIVERGCPVNVGGQYGFEDPDSWSDRNNEREPALSYMTEEREVVEKAAECAREARKQAALLAPEKVRDALLEKARQYEAVIPADKKLRN